jgi:hypothetical protein
MPDTVGFIPHQRKGNRDVVWQMEVLHGKTVPGVLKELTVFTIVYNLVRMVIWQSAALQHIAVERISFLDALRWLSASSTGMP